MKKIFVIFPLFAFLAFVFNWMPFTDLDPQQALDTVSSQYKMGLEEFYHNSEQLTKACSQYKTNTLSLGQLQKIHLNTRLAFKKIEFLIEYNDRELVKKSRDISQLLVAAMELPITLAEMYSYSGRIVFRRMESFNVRES
jgi:hypothetical protein